MLPILLINPNASHATTDMMLTLARETAGAVVRVHGETALDGPLMLTTPEAVDAAEAGVIDMAMRHAGEHSAVIVAAFGDPGVVELKRRLSIPVVGICEASMREAAAGARRFAVATTTPELAARIGATAERLGLGYLYAGTWLTRGEAFALVDDPPRLEDALANAVEASIRDGGAEAVIIGGGPLSRAAASLSARFAVPVIAPVAAAVRFLLG